MTGPDKENITNPDDVYRQPSWDWLGNGDHHVEVIFQESIRIAEYEFTVVDGTAKMVTKRTNGHRVHRR